MVFGEERTNSKKNGILPTKVHSKKKTMYEKIPTRNAYGHSKGLGSEGTFENDSHNVQSQY
jgi:hypothetical protein